MGAALHTLLAEAARPCRHAVGDRWQVDETCVKVAGHWQYVSRAIDQFGQVIDVFVSVRRDADAACRSSSGPSARRSCSRSRSSPIGRRPTRSRLRALAGSVASHRPGRQQSHRGGPRQTEGAPLAGAGLKQDRSATIVIAGHAFVQNVRRGCYELAIEEPASRRVAVAFDELALAI
jgi:transposase, IS6 family